MLSHLKSIIIEGNVVADPEAGTEPNGNPTCRFEVKSRRVYKTENDLETEMNYIEVVSYGRLAQMCAETLKKGRGLRVVGRLKDDRARGKIVIVVEHVEYKPEKAKD